MNNTIKFDMADAVARFSNDDFNKSCVATEFPGDATPTMAYIPFQLDKTAYEPEKALQEGTLFTTLNKPFCGRSLM